MYDDHHDLAGRYKTLVNERNDLRQKVSTLESKTCAACPPIEFVIEDSRDRSVQIAIAAFDHARIQYSKNLHPEAYCGPMSLGYPAPPLTINVRDR